MKRFYTFTLTAAIAAMTLHAADQKIKRSDLPAAVQNAVDQVSKGATVVGYSKEVEDGKTSYEVEMKVGALAKDVTLDANGKTLAVEQEVALASLPAAVKDGITKAAGTSKIGKVESVSEGNKMTYEVELKGGKAKELVVDQNGKMLSKK